MKRMLPVVIICLLVTALPGYGSEKKLPVIDGKVAVATVNGEPVSVEQVKGAIAAAHANRAEADKAGAIDYSAIVKRLVNTRLITIEARNMGLDELVEIRERVESYSRETLRTLLLLEQVKDAKADEDEVERLYQEMVKEWKITSIKFGTEDGAKKFEEALKSGTDFDDAVKKAMAEGLAQEADRGKYLKDRELTGPIARLVSQMEVGSASPIVSIGKQGFIVFRLEGWRIPDEEDRQAMKEAERQALNQKRVEIARAYYLDLRERSVKVDENLLAALDFDSSMEGFEKLLKDKRVIAEINGEKPITVGDLGEALDKKFYHGIERAIETKIINKRKKPVLDSMIEKKLLLKEARKQNIDKTQEYIDRVQEYERSLMFGAFVNKVIIPDIKLDIKTLKEYYEDNVEEYTLPKMVRIKSIAFAEKSEAVNSLNKLRQGTDFNWLRATADGQLNDKSPGILKFEGKLLTVSSLPEAMRRTLSEVKPGDFRLYESPEGRYYVLYVYEVILPELQPFEEVKKEITKKVFDEKVKKAVEDYAERLKEYYPVKIYAKDVH